MLLRNKIEVVTEPLETWGEESMDSVISDHVTSYCAIAE
ncbi:hypothetical protein VCHA53O466_40017 [Vibrio chagasii]|nr:hypothetical protein VCHA53O466_40017 [Vibrio chagasii]